MSCVSCRSCDINAVYLKNCPTGSISDTTICSCNSGFIGDGFQCQLVSSGFMCSLANTWLSQNCVFEIEESTWQETDAFCVAPNITCSAQLGLSTAVIAAAVQLASSPFIPTNTSAAELHQIAITALQDRDLAVPLQDNVPFFSTEGLILWAVAGTLFPAGLAMQVFQIIMLQMILIFT